MNNKYPFGLRNLQKFIKDLFLKDLFKKRKEAKTRINDYLTSTLNQILDEYKTDLITEQDIKKSLINHSAKNKDYYDLLKLTIKKAEEKNLNLPSLKRELSIHFINKIKERLDKQNFIREYEQLCFQLLKESKNKERLKEAKKIFSDLQRIDDWIKRNYPLLKRSLPEKTIIIKNTILNPKFQKLIKKKEDLVKEEGEYLKNKIVEMLRDHKRLRDKKTVVQFIIKYAYGSSNAFQLKKLILTLAKKKGIKIPWLEEKIFIALKMTNTSFIHY